MTKAILTLVILLVAVMAGSYTPDESIVICSDSVNGFQLFKQFFNKEYQTAEEEADA
jgi:hypothetical protein